MKNICDSWEEVKISTLTRIWEKLIPIRILMDDFEGFRTSVEEADVAEIAQELEVEPEDVTELLQSHDKTLMDEKFLLWMIKGSGFLRWSLPWKML